MPTAHGLKREMHQGESVRGETEEAISKHCERRCLPREGRAARVVGVAGRYQGVMHDGRLAPSVWVGHTVAVTAPVSTRKPLLRASREHKFWCVVVVVIGLIFGIGALVPWAMHHGRGDPDPGHRRLSALKPVLSALPSSAREVRTSASPAFWDSCDGEQHGWSGPTVDAQFVTSGAVAPVAAHIVAALHRLGWVGEGDSMPGAWVLEKTIAHSNATVQLLGPDDQTGDWDLQAEIPAVVHPLDC